MKTIYLLCLFSVMNLLNNLILGDEIFASEKNRFHNNKPQGEVLKNILNISDNELYLLANDVNEDGLAGESDYAQILLIESIRKNPTNINTLLEFAHLTDMQPLMPVQKMQKRFGFIYQAFLIEPNNPKVRFKLAELFFELKQKDLFQQMYADTMREFPDHLETHLESIRLLSQKNPKLAIELANKILQNGADISDFLPYFLTALEKTDKENFSTHLLQYAEKYPNRWLWYHLAMQYVKEKKYDNAENAFQKSIDLGNIIAGRLQLGIIQYRNQNKINKAIANLQTLIATLKNKPFISTDIIYFAHTQLACALLESQNTQETIKELNFLARYAFQNQKYFISTANEFIQKGQEQLLENSMKIAIQNDPMFAFPYNVLADILKKQKKEKQSLDMQAKFILLSSQTN